MTTTRPARLALPGLLAGALAFAALHTAGAQQPPARPIAPPAQPALSVAHVVNRVPGLRGRNPAAPCVGEQGCPAPRALPVCASRITPLTPAQAWAQRFQQQGRSVTVASRLQTNAACTEMACAANTCCNGCSGRMGLESPGSGGLALELGDRTDPAFQCRGDDSGVCCGTEVPSGPVLVIGTLQPVPNSGGAWQLANPTLCRLP